MRSSKVQTTESIKQFDQRGRLSIAHWKGEHVRVIETENEIILRKVNIVEPLSAESRATLFEGLEEAKGEKTAPWSKGDLSFVETDE